MAPIQDPTGFDNLLLDKIAAVNYCATPYPPDFVLEDSPRSVTPALLNALFQSPQTRFTETPTGTLLTQAPYDAPQGMPQDPYLQFQDFPDPWAVRPQTAIGPFENSISASQWNDISGMGPSFVGLTQSYMELPVIPQPLPSPPMAQLPTPSWVEVPQRAYGHGRRQWDFRPSEPIPFNVNCLPGINMRDALRKHFVGLEGRDDPMFEEAAGAISCRLLFPGYPSNRSAQIATLGCTKDRARITRSKLAYEIGKKLNQYLDSMAGHSMKKSVDRRWKIGEGCMRLENMYLVRLVSVSKGSFQPEIWVVDS